MKSQTTPYSPFPTPPLRDVDYRTLQKEFTESGPFNHIVIEDFLNPETAKQIVAEFPTFDEPVWHVYDNAIEIKKTLNNYNIFKPATYSLFTYLNSPEFVSRLEVLVGEKLYPDIGLNGGGLHTHSRGGKLNTHLDYSIHPKLGLERRLNLLVYVTPDWDVKWGGSLGLWKQKENREEPGDLAKEIDCIFNRAVLFDTTQNSWHGLPKPITCPEHIYRNSLAVYYLCQPREEVSSRGKALFSPYGDQANDPKVLELIKKRASVETASDVWNKK